MRYQKDSYSCGAAAVVNAVRCFGKKVPERIVRSFSSTTKENGTDEHGIVAALRGLGFDGESFELFGKTDAIRGLTSYVRSGKPVIICTQNLQHWVTVVGLVGDMFIVVDPTRTKGNKLENGCHVYSDSQLARTWQSRDGKFFGVVCKKK